MSVHQGSTHTVGTCRSYRLESLVTLGVNRWRLLNESQDASSRDFPLAGVGSEGEGASDSLRGEYHRTEHSAGDIRNIVV